ncbi:MAG: MoxR family ATPase [Gammaproteobacteria bacterium]|nr:MoxR family ATPase [Gammaproteobacteria bacterium]MYK45375.1 MoxR family ATPase [Gammaproteobacteria bacterium]
MDPDRVATLAEAIKAEVHKAVVGQEATLELLLVGLLTNGHVLIEGVPGTAKTMIARCFSASLDLNFGRIQFTPDLMPGDVIGTNIFNFADSRFVLTKGTVFTEILLADEINRTPPKTQAALLQAMQERTVTIDGEDYPLSSEFMVVATQNPIEQQGTYPLPEAQLDRFLFKHVVDYPTRDDERDIVRAHGSRTTMTSPEAFGIEPVAGPADLEAMRADLEGIRLGEDLVDYVVDLVRASREHPGLSFGASPRAANMLASAARAYAALDARDYVIPDDIKHLAPATLRHRIVLSPGSEIEGLHPDQIVGEIIEQTPVPK